MTDDMIYAPPPFPPAQQPRSTPPRRSRRVVVGLGLVGAGVAAGAIIGGTVLSSAATPSSTPTSSSSSASSTDTDTDTDTGRKADHGAASVRSDEKAVTGSLLTTLKAAALKAVPGGTVYRVETDAGDGTYEAHMTKADGTEVTVKFDKSGAVTGVEAGMGKGDPHGR